MFLPVRESHTVTAKRQKKKEGSDMKEMKTNIFLHGCLVLFYQFVHLLGKSVPLVLQLLVKTQPVLVHLRLQLVFQSHQLFLVLPPHPLVP